MAMKPALLFLVFAVGCSDGKSANNAPCTTIDGVCLVPPVESVARTSCSSVTAFCDSSGMTAPDLACIAAPKAPSAGPATVTVTGFIHAYGTGPNTSGISVAFDDATALLAGMDIGAVSTIASAPNVQLDAATQRACDLDTQLGCSMPAADCGPVVCADGLDGRPDQTKYCRQDAGATSCADRLRWEARYTVANIPTNKQLVVRTTGGANWSPLVTWNVVLSTSDHVCASQQDNNCLDLSNPNAPIYRLDIYALSLTDYFVLPMLAGLSGGIPKGQGAVIGETHDCGDVRLGNAVVGLTTVPPPLLGNSPFARTSYFAGGLGKPGPDSLRTATGPLGGYSVLGIKPGKVHVVAGALVDTTQPLIEVGSFDAFVYPDTVSFINLNGGKRRP